MCRRLTRERSLHICYLPCHLQFITTTTLNSRGCAGHHNCVRTLFTTAAILFGDVYLRNRVITPQHILNCLRCDAPRSDGYTMRINMQLWLHHTTRPQHQSRPSDGKSAVTIHPVCLTSSMLSLGDETQFPESSKAAAPRREDRRGDRR